MHGFCTDFARFQNVQRVLFAAKFDKGRRNCRVKNHVALLKNNDDSKLPEIETNRRLALLISGPRVRVPGGASDIERQIVRFGVLFYVGKRLHTFCTSFAHLPKSGALLRKVCTACFPLHKNGTCRGEAPPSAIADRSVTQTPHWGVCCFRKREGVKRTRLSSILCVRLRPSAGWLQGSLCRRFLLPPAFHFAGAEVLPGSGLGNRSAVDRGTRSVQTPSVPLSTGGTTLSAAPVRWASHPGAGTVARNCCISPGRSARPV